MMIDESGSFRHVEQFAMSNWLFFAKLIAQHVTSLIIIAGVSSERLISIAVFKNLSVYFIFSQKNKQILLSEITKYSSWHKEKSVEISRKNVD